MQKVISAFRGMEISQLPCLLVKGCQFISIALSDRLSRVYATVPFYRCISLVNGKTNDLTSWKSHPQLAFADVILVERSDNRKYVCSRRLTLYLHGFRNSFIFRPSSKLFYICCNIIFVYFAGYSFYFIF